MPNVICPRCNSTKTRKHSKVKRKILTYYNRLVNELRQIYYCNSCCRHFTINDKSLSNSRYSKALYKLYEEHRYKPLKELQAAIKQKSDVVIPITTLHDWKARDTIFG